MRINMPKWLIILALIAVIGCAPSQDDSYGSGFVVVSEDTWSNEHTTPYPFTVPSGDISCGFHAEFGREIYFEPTGFIYDDSIGTPLNKAASNSLKQADMIPNVPYSIKKGADLGEAIQLGLKVCNEQRDMLERSR